VQLAWAVLQQQQLQGHLDWWAALVVVPLLLH
jgi:hypothetical protein